MADPISSFKKTETQTKIQTEFDSEELDLDAFLDECLEGVDFKGGERIVPEVSTEEAEKSMTQHMMQQIQQMDPAMVQKMMIDPIIQQYKEDPKAFRQIVARQSEMILSMTKSEGFKNLIIPIEILLKEPPKEEVGLYFTLKDIFILESKSNSFATVEEAKKFIDTLIAQGKGTWKTKKEAEKQVDGPLERSKMELPKEIIQLLRKTLEVLGIKDGIEALLKEPELFIDFQILPLIGASKIPSIGLILAKINLDQMKNLGQFFEKQNEERIPNIDKLLTIFTLQDVMKPEDFTQFAKLCRAYLNKQYPEAKINV